jgi:Tfp pilus assembly protein PilO
MALSKREWKLLVATITVIVVVVNYLLLSWLLKDWRSLHSGLHNKRTELASMRAVIDRAPGWQRDYDELRRSLGRTAVNYEQSTDVLKKVEEIGVASGIVIENRRSLPPVEKDVYRELPVQCTIQATVESLVKFLHTLQTEAGFLRFDELKVSPRPDNPNILRCEVQVRALAAKSESPAS